MMSVIWTFNLGSSSIFGFLWELCVVRLQRVCGVFPVVSSNNILTF